MTQKKFYSTAEVADQAGVSKQTILRWIKQRKIPEPARDRNRWRIFTEKELRAIVKYAGKVIRNPEQQPLFNERRRA